MVAFYTNYSITKAPEFFLFLAWLSSCSFSCYDVLCCRHTRAGPARSARLGSASSAKTVGFETLDFFFGTISKYNETWHKTWYFGYFVGIKRHMNRDISCSNVTNRHHFFPWLGTALRKVRVGNARRMHHAACMVDHQPLLRLNSQLAYSWRASWFSYQIGFFEFSRRWSYV